jgi:hypothetical protein
VNPTIGRIVHYCLTEHDAKAINRRRVHDGSSKPDWPMGAQSHTGNGVRGGELVPMIVWPHHVVVWPNEHGPNFDGVNGQVILDGNDSLWVTSVKEGTDPGTWRWPEIVR